MELGVTQVPTILQEILAKKKTHKICHATRNVPLNMPNLEQIFVIAEIKRASPSAGKISEILEPSVLAESYLQAGALAISVLCEQDYFHGDLEDLRVVKNAFKSACVLRKDFITEVEQIKEAYDFGADMVLLIAAVFLDENNGGFARLLELYNACKIWNLTPLIEVHNVFEVEFIAPLNASLIGVNSRNLHTFGIDKIRAYNLLDSIKCVNPNAKVIFESSLNCSFDGFVVGNLGFDGILCGSYLVRSKNPKETLKKLKSAMQKGKESTNAFYKNVFKLLDSALGFVKICGITNTEDAKMCAKALYELRQENIEKVGALGFILEPKSPRFVQDLNGILNVLKDYPNVLKVAVIKDDVKQMQKALEFYQSGKIDALQLHGVKSQYFGGMDLKEAEFVYYAVVNVGLKKDLEDLDELSSPFVLLDSKSALGGGSGECIDIGVLESLEMQYLCVAGGVGIQNIVTLKQMGAKMLDINSSIEKCAGNKDKDKLQALISNLKDYL
ncbi:bifunctional indole-3-glycerol phosphate synthase/phosphoribosylanthranilate isomerase [Helicobacter winghamensis]|uniref:N-(5'-phosphoribosyl)anthranilate isomerase n=1 Tax=Helicobacter winghamensis TaxID=157268 RepID=A0A2N3PHB9_9HELI|nr:bifunctional indole-3-glycerol phosphate synthase/phosphoribosylanthranilate isomerase [Helicobacter winghamensis]PKT79495.1 bifunctional indole-3-glycerol phosphate synthase/phosphoribosylanthranilate isomerase [Helicobacter winghamensis]PKT79782.1 bifunctional indole-3-glycerol phosphate synthase/phosphoribosylanthranilate isomerase [Helicobacter winghamensis]PKT79865.1 bifunctional indole-3-glycerol phosphate synthase/phosphoribosylanthranilate isomerase [Helicobacter winghamensis]